MAVRLVAAVACVAAVSPAVSPDPYPADSARARRWRPLQQHVLPLAIATGRTIDAIRPSIRPSNTSIMQASHRRSVCLRWRKTNASYRRLRINCMYRSRNLRNSLRTSIRRWTNAHRGHRRARHRTTAGVTIAAAVAATSGNLPRTCHPRHRRLRRSTRAAAVWVAVRRWRLLLRMRTPRTRQRAEVVRRGEPQSTGSISRVPTLRWEARRERCCSSRTFTRRETFTGGRRCLCRRHRTRRTIG